MSCSAPIDIPTNGSVSPISGTFNCVYDVNLLSGAAVSLSKTLNYLSIKCASNNSSRVSFYNAGIYTPSEIRIYKPSLHTYNGARADAELLIVHSIVSSYSTIVSVPISMSGGNKSDELSNIIKSANTLNANTIAMNASVPISAAVDANELVPSKPYYVYNGTLPYDSCGGNYYYAVFTDPISSAYPINNLQPSNIKVAPSPALLQKSKDGPNNGAGSASDEYVLFEVVDTGDENDSTSHKKSTSADSKQPIFTTLNMLWGILIVFVLGLIYWIFTKNDKGNTPASSTSGGASSTSSVGDIGTTADA